VHTEYWTSLAAEPASFAAIVGQFRSETDSVPDEVWVDAGSGGAAAFRVRTGAASL
jgi:hypothetical protein